MKIYYTIETNGKYCEESDEVMCGSTTFAYEPDLDELMEVIYETFASKYNIPLEVAEKIIKDFDLEEACEEYFEEDIKEYFEEYAYNECFGG